ncbi:MAG TPA: bifunctional ornithine acetyltransferase/N-acetylglutamate synthase, partial [Spirochaetota bacterium]
LSSTKNLIDTLSVEGGQIIPRTIMTTDTRPKESAREFETSKGVFRIAGTAKGSGMIAPNMATMLAFIITDAPIAKKDQDGIFRPIVEKTFNAITIDGDTSTNDTAILLSPRGSESISSSQDLASFEEALYDVCRELAYLLVKDAEGGTKCVTVTVQGAANSSDAKKIARSVSESLLVKTAIFGSDPNWGRIACAAGYSGVNFDAHDLAISIGGIQLLSAGEPIATDMEKLSAVMKNNEYTVLISIGKGEGSFSFMTSDLSYDYVKINGEYST